MPLSARARIEIYLPEQQGRVYKKLLKAFINEFTMSFGGCTVIHKLDGHYLSDSGEAVPDPITIIYSDTPFDLEENRNSLAIYTDRLREYAFEALEEESILVAVLPVHHSL